MLLESFSLGVVGVGNKPNALALVGRVDTCSRKYVRLYVVARRFQISLHFVEYQSIRPINKAANVFAHDPTRLDSLYDSKHLRP